MEKLNFSLHGITSAQPFDPVAFGKVKADTYNQTEGDLSGLDCRKCLNRGKIAHPKEDGNVAFSECDCILLVKLQGRYCNPGLQHRCADHADLQEAESILFPIDYHQGGLRFILFTSSCFAALGAMNSEINDRKWVIFPIMQVQF